MARRNFFDEVRSNKIRSICILVFFILFVAFIGAIIGYYYTAGAPGGLLGGIIISCVVAGLYALIVFNTGSSMILSSSNARPITKQEFPHLYHSVEGLAIAAGIPAPKAYVIDDPALNAFATGTNPKNGVVVFTTGLIAKLNREELEGVIAHEISHIKNYDIRVMLLATVLVGALTLLSDILLRTFLFGGSGRGGGNNDNKATIIFIIVGLILVILSPIIGQLIKLAVSRKREYLADASGAMLTRYPQGLANALRKISDNTTPLKSANKATAHFYISSPLRTKKGGFKGLFSTHPPIEERIKRLEAM
jgi:heat shock protein HtpX